MGPYEVDVVFDNRIVRLVMIEETRTYFLVNGHHVKLYHHPTSKDVFIKHLSNKYDLMVVGVENDLFASYYKLYIYIYIMLLLLTRLSFARIRIKI